MAGPHCRSVLSHLEAQLLKLFCLSARHPEAKQGGHPCSCQLREGTLEVEIGVRAYQQIESLERSQSCKRAPGHQVEVLLHQGLVDDPTPDHPLLPGELSGSRAQRKDGLLVS